MRTRHLQKIPEMKLIAISHIKICKNPSQTLTKLVADELGEDHNWSEIFFREATKQDKERIKPALDSEGSFVRNRRAFSYMKNFHLTKGHVENPHKIR